MHYYPPPEQANTRFYSLMDQHNIHLEHQPQTSKKEKVEYIFECATWVLYNFVSTHPFVDGNGRMCHLLANYIVSLITPFPVSLYHSQRSQSGGREDYVDALVKCDKSSLDEGLGELASMLVEGAWHSWNSLFKNLKERNKSGFSVIIVQKSKPQNISERVK